MFWGARAAKCRSDQLGTDVFLVGCEASESDGELCSSCVVTLWHSSPHNVSPSSSLVKRTRKSIFNAHFTSEDASEFILRLVKFYPYTETPPREKPPYVARQYRHVRGLPYTKSRVRCPVEERGGAEFAKLFANKEFPASPMSHVPCIW